MTVEDGEKLIVVDVAQTPSEMLFAEEPEMREQLAEPMPLEEQRREAYMRKCWAPMAARPG